MQNKSEIVVPGERVENVILLIRGEKVILDSDLVKLYGVTTKRLNEQVKRNKERFPEDFMFQLSEDEFENLKSHFATSSSGWGGRRKLPFAFTEHGAIMAASVLNSSKAVEMKDVRFSRVSTAASNRSCNLFSYRYGHTRNSRQLQIFLFPRLLQSAVSGVS